MLREGEMHDVAFGKGNGNYGWMGLGREGLSGRESLKAVPKMVILGFSVDPLLRLYSYCVF